VPTFGHETPIAGGALAVHNFAPSIDLAREETMTGAITALGIVVGSTMPICYVLMRASAKKRWAFDLAQSGFLD
jgi:hypothetical protein